MKTTVVICCYNSASRLGPTLEALSRQVAPGLDWELVLVDNNCTDETGELARALWTNSTVPLRIVEESIPGLVYARARAVAVSNSPLLVFCDDDNHLAPDYLQVASTLMAAHPRIAMVGGVGEVAFENNLPEWFHEFENYYACGERLLERKSVPFLAGAGIVVRRTALESLERVKFRSFLVGRKGQELSSGEDIEMSFALKAQGWELMLEPRLRFKHYMPPSRLTEQYLVRLAKAFGAAHPVLGEYDRALNGGGILGRLKSLIPFPLLCLVFSFARLLPLLQLKYAGNLGVKVRANRRLGAAKEYWRLLCSGESLRIRREIRGFIRGAKTQRGLK